MTTLITIAVLLLFLALLLVQRLFWCAMSPPHFNIGHVGSIYMRRWYVIPRNRLFNIYLHEILRSDDDRALHDHPWVNLSIVLRGGYREIMPWFAPTFLKPVPPQESKWRGPGSVVLRMPSQAHRLEVADGTPCWSLFITGPNVRSWGFWCPKGWTHWQNFVDMTNTGAIGPGCGSDEVGAGGRQGVHTPGSPHRAEQARVA